MTKAPAETAFWPWTEAEAREQARRFDPVALPAEFFDQPFPWYHALRCFEPVHRNPDGSWFLTRYADLALAYRDRRFSSDKRHLFGPKFGQGQLYRHHTTSLVFNDPPYHTLIRRLIMGALQPRAVRAMEPLLIELVERLLDRAEALGRFDLIEHYAAAIPVEVIGNLLRIPHDERGPLRDWSLAILGALEPVLSAEQLEAGNRAVEEFCDYLRRLVTERRAHLSDDPGDVLSQLIRGEQDGRRLDENELLQNCIFLLNAGHETTTNLIGNGVHALLTHPAELARLRAEPALTKSAVEEILRYESSNQLGNREVIEAVEIGGIVMPAGSQVVLCIGAANRDPEHFADPDRFDIGRSPNNHLAFGTGIHACAGMSLARLEGRVAIERIVRRFPALRLAGTPLRRQRARFRGFASAPLAVE